MNDPLRIANCSGFYGDRLSAASEMVDDGPIDVLTGDWLAELTMLILAKTKARRPDGGFGRTFVTQMEQVMGTCLDRGIKVVANAGGLDPAGCAEAVAQVADRLGLAPRIAHITGDDLLGRLGHLAAAGVDLSHLDTGEPLGDPARFVSANAYLGCWGIAEALTRGADIVITGRVTDAALVCGPAAWHHGWTSDDLDPLAGAVVAGHIIECGTQATGGNYSFFTELDGLSRTGFPWAEIHADGSSVIGKHDGTGGAVTIGTVTSQLLYEIKEPDYPGPDVTARFDTVELSQIGPDRVLCCGTIGRPPPPTLKVAMNEVGGFRSDVSIALTGLDIEAKAALVEGAIWASSPVSRDELDEVAVELVRTDRSDPMTNAEAVATLRITVKDANERRVADAVNINELALSTIPGFFGLGGGGRPRAYGVYRPALVPADLVPQYVTIDGETTIVEAPTRSPLQPSKAETPPSPVAGNSGGHETAERAEGSLDAVHNPPERSEQSPVPSDPCGTRPLGDQRSDVDAPPTGELTETVPLGRIVGSRSGDKGGTANLGVFARCDSAFEWARSHLTVERIIELLPEAGGLEVERHELANIRALNFVIVGLLQDGVAASTRQDPQAKSLGEWLRARMVEVPTRVILEADACSDRRPDPVGSEPR